MELVSKLVSHTTSVFDALTARRTRARRGRSTKVHIEQLEMRAMFAAGFVDETFAFGSGYSVAFNGDSRTSAYGMDAAVDKKGRIVAVGSSVVDGFAVARFLENGALDAAFSGDGTTTIEFDTGGYASGWATSVAIDSKGRIVVAGSNSRSGSGTAFAVARLTASGDLDQTFGIGGRTTIEFSGRNTVQCEDLTIDSKGRIVVVGPVTSPSGNTDFGVARLTTSGRLDTSFGVNGQATIAFDVGDTNSDWASRVATDSKGRVIVAGTVAIRDMGGFSYNDRDFGVARLTPSGFLDATFNFVGRVTIPFDRGGNLDDRLSGLALDSKGRIVVSGTVQNTGQSGVSDDFGIARLTSAGAIDRTFGEFGGRTVVAGDAGGDHEDAVRGMCIDGRGRIIVAGYAERGFSGDYDFGIVRLTPKGALDSRFGWGGKNVIRLDRGDWRSGMSDKASSVALDSKGRIVMVGGSQFGDDGRGNPLFDFVVVRVKS